MTGLGESARRGDRDRPPVTGPGFGWLPVIGVTALGGAVARLALPWVLGRAVDALVTGVGVASGSRAAGTGLAEAGARGTGVAGAAAGPGGLSWVGWAVVAVAVAVACDLAGSYAGAASVAATTAHLRGRLLRHLLAVGPDRTRPFAPGDLVNRTSAGTASAAHARPALVLLAAAVVPPAGSLVLLAVLDPWLAGAFLAGLGLVALVLRAFTRRTTEAARNYQEAQGDLAGRLAEALTGARTIAAAGTLAREESRVLRPLAEMRRHGVLAWHVLARTGAQGALVGPLVLVAVLATGGLALVAGRITAGDLFAASQYAVAGAGLGGLTGLLGRLARARAGAARLAELHTLEPVTYGTRDLPPGPGRLEFRNVTVHAPSRPGRGAEPPPSTNAGAEPGAEPGAGPGAGPGAIAEPGVGPGPEPAQSNGSSRSPGPRSGATADPSPARGAPVGFPGRRTVLDQVTLDLPGGTAVAVVGRSGAGKSVLAALAARLRDPDSGTVLLDGVPLPELRHSALRAAVACAVERPVLVGDTVADAVGVGRPLPGVLAATRATRAHDFVSRLPRGYGTALADAPMSGGEAQRLGLARAWHADRLLVLDDATSSLDMVTEMRISRTLTEDHGRRTRLIVTHRVSTAARADVVVWLDAGRVRGVGPHDTLWSDPDYRAVFPA
ncbi:ABC transporter ATP-binding protein [Longispora sp. K20-0274]|uniref:ATP-binding cassette domain-containing protein n=1 Tax=Longispora sp. K20-0274 TaxID=3088255 RepID=UPI00399BB24A